MYLLTLRFTHSVPILYIGVHWILKVLIALRTFGDHSDPSTLFARRCQFDSRKVGEIVRAGPQENTPGTCTCLCFPGSGVLVTGGLLGAGNLEEVVDL